MGDTNEYTLKNAIELMLHRFNIKEKLVQVHIRHSWEKLMGKTIASRTIDVAIDGKTLFVKLNSAVLRNELSFSKEKLIKILNHELGKDTIENVVIK